MLEKRAFQRASFRLFEESEGIATRVRARCSAPPHAPRPPVRTPRKTTVFAWVDRPCQPPHPPPARTENDGSRFKRWSHRRPSRWASRARVARTPRASWARAAPAPFARPPPRALKESWSGRAPGPRPPSRVSAPRSRPRTPVRRIARLQEIFFRGLPHR